MDSNITGVNPIFLDEMIADDILGKFEDYTLAQKEVINEGAKELLLLSDKLGQAETGNFIVTRMFDYLVGTSSKVDFLDILENNLDDTFVGTINYFKKSRLKTDRNTIRLAQSLDSEIDNIVDNVVWKLPELNSDAKDINNSDIFGLATQFATSKKYIPTLIINTEQQFRSVTEGLKDSNFAYQVLSNYYGWYSEILCNVASVLRSLEENE